MAKSQKRTNPVILRRGVGIGSGNAESDDEFLFECFVEHPAVEHARRLTHAGMILAGRTGSGKTAILRHIEGIADHTAALDPFEMAMSYVANSDALRFLQAITEASTISALPSVPTESSTKTRSTRSAKPGSTTRESMASRLCKKLHACCIGRERSGLSSQPRSASSTRTWISR
jgi:energy-coupling factor transporter ATP-binding protein EcfA2